ncbi:indolepyruvate ferredoxin oxidoreductase family protein [Magnetospirillum sulfuroxidans]|uniref:Indolepyruvate ferredoxin oxidoreductase family protein n=1 Tax=Magnetospirillum sulfuroxidans TaxID=611300 RepID=A0ABS5IBG1_9PROT|nr:indolepyruvate ferredoxin oxidoreductase family protein [Magnetospirillum sulfuroxidans]MBR9971730.1 indolepyruvate ferredoxin oxidoreductase family protein [Magnetospirillum sulfuroxidans]
MSIAAKITLEDKYTARNGRVFVSGVQALVRLPMLQRDRDRALGLNTAGFISGYRGSPLSGLDKELWRAEKHLAAHDIRFQPGLNEDLAATAIWGSQQIGLSDDATVDGVFAYWYGKGPGLDRSADAFKHANSAGTARHGGVLVLAGDDHGARSSTMAHQSEQLFMALGMPVLNPANVQELLDYGLIGWALSRYSGLWVGLKAITETVESSATIDIDPWRVSIVAPSDFPVPADGLSIRWPDRFLAQEERLLRHKLPAALAFARANCLDRVVVGGPYRRLGIITTGKASQDVMQALDDLGIDGAYAAAMGLAIYKVGMTWPLEPDGIRAFCQGLEEVVVIEEKRPVIEDQLRAQLYNWRDDVRPRVVGKTDETGAPLLPSHGELNPALLARMIAGRIGRFYTSLRVRQRLEWLDAKQTALASLPQGFARVPYFCAGCPHNSSTVIPEGSHAMGGIGCHIMATWMPERHTETYTQMGGEGANWIGQAPFTQRRHIFQNLGDGTYYHSGLLAIRACIAARVPITYKILFNDAVAMTGGQPVDGPISVAAIAAQVRAEGVDRIAIVSDRPIAYADMLPPGATIHHRDSIIALQQELRAWPGVSVLIHDQTCAAEKRRRRKRGLMEDPPERLFINEKVCEGCGDCGDKSNCVAVVPVETEWGRKRAIDQSACNKDFSCAKGFCPAFVFVSGAELKRDKTVASDSFAALPDPVLPSAAEPYSIVVTGIGGTGVVTVAQVLGMAAHLDGKAVTSLDQTGLAQKNGAVVSHLRLCEQPSKLYAARIADGGAQVLLACDMVTAAGFDTLSKLKAGDSTAVVNDHQSMPATFTHAPDLAFPAQSMRQAISAAAAADFIDATQLATALLADAIGANLFIVGYAWQRGLLPLSWEAIQTAIDLNGAAPDFNKQAFLWGRRAAHDRRAIEALLTPPAPITRDLDSAIAHRVAELQAWGNHRWAERFSARIAQIRHAESAITASTALTEAAAHALFKLMSYKDEYEVARLYSDGSFAAALADHFQGWQRIEPHLAPPWFGSRKHRFGPWMLKLMKGLAQLKAVRGSWADPFGHTAERRMERALIGEYEDILDRLLARLNKDNHALAVSIAAIPQQIRGFGPVKATAVTKARAAVTAALGEYEKPLAD